MKRLFSAAGLVSGLVLSCSEEPQAPLPGAPVGGSTAQAGAGSGGTAGSTAGTGGSEMGGTSGSSGSAGTGGAASACATDCSVTGQVCEMATAMCICPPFNPDHCPADAVCTDFTDDPDHCGDCMTVCPEFSACSASACTPEPTEIYSTTGCERLNMVLAGTTIYFLDVGAGTVSSLPVAGGTPVELATGLTGASAFTLDDTNIYVVTGMTLSRIPIGGGTAEVVVTEATPIFDVALQDDVLYYAVGTNVKSIDAAEDDGMGTVVATAVDAGEPQSVAVDGDLVLWGASVAYNVEVDSISGDALLKLGASQGNLVFGHGSLKTDGTNVYWINGSNIERRAYDQGDGQEHVADSRDSDPITAFAITATTAYFGAGGNLEKAVFDQDGIWMARGQSEIMSVVVDATSVYWSTDDCKIRKTGL